MNNQTLNEYLKLAEHFYLTRLNGKSPTPKRLRDALKAAASDYRPNYWRRLRKAIEVEQRDRGFDKAADAVASLKNPITTNPDNKANVKPKQRRIKAISEDDENQLIEFLVSNQEKEVFAAVRLTKYLGCRPAELRTLKFDEKGGVQITGAKKRNDRGLDRFVTIDNQELYSHLFRMHQLLIKADRADPIRYAQKRLATLTRKLWPQRKALPSLYSFRHQMGADLKASGKSSIEVAAIMGHRSTESVSVYGNRALSRHSRSYIKASKATMENVIKKSPSTPYSRQPDNKQRSNNEPSLNRGLG